MSIYQLNQEQYAAKARQVAAEGCVLLKNERQALPLKSGDRLAVFGRIASTYYKSGLGSGGMVNTNYVVGILDALKEEADISILEGVQSIYDQWMETHPFDQGKGWGQVPWSQEEMPVTEALFEAAKDATVAVVVIGRTAGEDQDNTCNAGSYLLSETEETLIAEVAARFERTVVLLNVGNIIDMSWVERCHPASVVYVWQGGQEGGHGVADVLMGRVNPCGHLTDTIAKSLEDYPSHPYYGGCDKNYYTEDIYVGYRYFETFAKDRVLYPFGYGLSYTTFNMEAKTTVENDSINVEIKIKNIGKVPGKAVPQLYIGAPCGLLGKAARVLVGFTKSGIIEPDASEIINMNILKSVYASFDDSGVTGHKDAFVLEAGEYHLYLGEDVASAEEICVFKEDFKVIEQLEEALAPVESFERFKNADGQLQMENVPVCTVSCAEHRNQQVLKEIEYTGDLGYKLSDVYRGNVTMDQFVAQLSNEDLIAIARGEGMCSPKVTPGTAAAFGGLTESLRHFGIPALCATDGPSGIRMDCGTKAFSLPNGTLLGCTFDIKTVQELYTFTGKELRQNRIDTLLGPGMNIHRYPLNGRNFEYISEDPLLTGKIAAAQLKGMSIVQSSGTAKHFATNNQEAHRRQINAVVSARALREIYLRGFEIAVKDGNCHSVMTTYAPLNGLWTSGSYDLNSRILREQWGFDGIVMTDWWAEANDFGEPSNPRNHAAMVKAGNDLYMTVEDAGDHSQDNILEQFVSGDIKRSELARNARHILEFALQSVAMQYELGNISGEELEERKSAQKEEDRVPDDLKYYSIKAGEPAVIDVQNWNCEKNEKYMVGIIADVHNPGTYDITVTASSELNALAQIPITVYVDSELKTTISFRGTEGKMVCEKRDMGLIIGNHYMKIYFGASGLKVKEIKLIYREAFEFPF